MPSVDPRAAPGDDRARLRRDLAYAPFPSPDDAGSIVARFVAIAAQHAGRPAVIADDTVMTYAELDARSRAVAAVLASDRPTAVALLMDQGAGFVIAFLAALRTGALAVPLDPAYPDAILRSLLDHAGVDAILTDPASRDLAHRVAGSRPVVDIAGGHAAGLERDPAIVTDAPATLFYTSGTTGRPKGVLDSHANILDNVRRYVDSLGIGPGDRLSLVHGPMFSGLVSSLWSAFLTGAAVIPVDVRRAGLDRLADTLERAEATMWHLVPSLYRRLLAASRTWPSVRVVRLEGDAATWDDVRLARRRFAIDTLVVNGLGATETGLVAQWFARPDDAPDTHGTMPVGYPVAGIGIAVLDGHGRPAPTDVPGELVVRGSHLAVGYWADEARTAAAFVRDATDPARRAYRTGDIARIDATGSLQVLGRRDGVHKVRGQTVDPLHLERQLLAIPGVTGAAAVTRLDDTDVRLVGYVVGADGLDGAAIRRTLARELFGADVPSAVVVLPALPLTAAGKVDRAALPAPDRARPRLDVAYAPPRDPLEERLAELWAAQLDIRPVGIHDEFFDLGGDSLGAAAMLLEVGHWLGREIPPDVLARAATVAELATELRLLPRDVDGELVVLSSGPGPTVFLIHADGGNPLFYRSIARALGGDATVISIQPPDLASKSAFEPIRDKAERYVRRIVAVQHEGPFHVVGQCFGAAVAHEVGRILAERGETVGTLTLLGIGPMEFPRLVSASARRRFWRSRWRERLRSATGDGHRRDLKTTTGSTVRRASDLFRRRLTVSAARAGIASWLPVRDRSATMAFSTMTALAAETHRAAPFPGRLRVVVGQDARPRYLRDPGHDLGGLATDGVELVMLPGDDHAMLSEPGSQLLGRRLRAWVDAEVPGCQGVGSSTRTRNTTSR